MVCECWHACEDEVTRARSSTAHTGPHQELGGSEDNMVSSVIPELDSEQEEQDESAGDVDDMALMHAHLLLRKQWVGALSGLNT